MVLLAVNSLLTYGTLNNTTKLGKIVQMKLSKNPRNLAEFTTEYIDEQYNKLSKYSSQLKYLEEALRYQPQLIIRRN